MLNEKQLKWFEDLTQLDGVSGHEHAVAKYLYNAYSQYTDEIMRDNLGSIVAVRRCGIENAPKVLVLGHMDEVGFLVREIKETGVVTLHPVGGWFSQVLLAQRVRVTTRDGRIIHGAIGAKPPHMLSAAERLEPIQIPQMTVDLGASSRDEVLGMGVQVGDMVVVEGDFKELNGGKRILAKAFDNRYGCVMGLDILDALHDKDLDFDLYVGASVQEEVGLRGAQTIANKINPDLAIILDCSPANDALDSKAIGRLGEGVLVRVMDGNMIATKDLIYKFVDLCDENNIKHQYYYSPGGTDAGVVHKAHSGIKTLTCCLCARNIHTCSSILDTEDYVGARSALLKFLDKKVWGDVIA